MLERAWTRVVDESGPRHLRGVGDVTSLTPALRQHYDELFTKCQVRGERLGAVDGVVDRAVALRARYEAVGGSLGCPWYVVAVVHSLEGGLRFDRHLHNGDPLTARTVRVPAGRPHVGEPPFTWEESARDALRLKGFHRWADWSLPGLLFKLEQYNGWGYRLHHPEVPTPYLWSFTTHYSKGKYVADGRFDPNAVSQQCGAVALLRRIAERSIARVGSPGPASPPEFRAWQYKEADVQTTLLDIALDDHGNGWTDWDPGLGREPVVVGLVAHGPFPPADGYWDDAGEDLTFRAQQRGNTVVVSAVNGAARATARVFVSVA